VKLNPVVGRAHLHFLVYAPQSGESMSEELGRADYSYFFVMRYFVPLLESLGTVVPLQALLPEADRCFDEITSNGGQALLLLFMPPHKIPEGLRCPWVPVFAWEYDRIPNENWGSDTRHNWPTVLAKSRGAITHSRFALGATLREMGPEFFCMSLPAPVWDRCQYAQQGSPAAFKQAWSLSIEGVVLDSKSLDLSPGVSMHAALLESKPAQLALSGVIYTSVFCPIDGRKNWHDILSAFVYAFRDQADATLLMKLVHHDKKEASALVLQEMQKLYPFRCRLVSVCGYLDDANYAQLVNGSSFTVNSSHGEGQCLPMMEFMSAGKPAIAPDHTAMAEYVRPDNSFVVKSSQEWTHWPHDPRSLLRCHRYRIDWESLRDAYLASWQVAQVDATRYTALSANAVAALQTYCSIQTVTAGMRRFLQAIGIRVAPQPIYARLWQKIRQRLSKFLGQAATPAP